MRQRSWEEADIKAGIRVGGSVAGVFIIARNSGRKAGFVAYIRAGWTIGFLPLHTFRHRSDRVFRSLDKLVRLIRDNFRYDGEISLFVAGDRRLRRFKALLPADRLAWTIERRKRAVGDGNKSRPERS